MIFLTITQNDIDEATHLRKQARLNIGLNHQIINPLTVKLNKVGRKYFMYIGSAKLNKQIQWWFINGEFKAGKYGVIIYNLIDNKLVEIT